MRLIANDSVVRKGDDRRAVAIVTWREGTTVKVKTTEGTRTFPRDEVELVAELIADAVRRGVKYSNAVSFAGKSTLQDLVRVFGYTAEERLRRDTLARVESQLNRAGLELHGDGEDRESRFWLRVAEREPNAVIGGTADHTGASTVELPTPHWPAAFGLDQGEELRFFRALTESDALVCVLKLPVEAPAWILPAWQGLLSWAYVHAQKFTRVTTIDPIAEQRVVAVSAGAVQKYLKPEAAVLELALIDRPHHLNIVALDQSAGPDIDRLKTIWPGQVFVFQPLSFVGEDRRDAEAALVRTLGLIGGRPVRSAGVAPEVSVPEVITWAKKSCRQLLAAGGLGFAALAGAMKMPKFRGSTEGAVALGLKAITAQWLAREGKTGSISFDEQKEILFEDTDQRSGTRVDIRSKTQGIFEIETMSGSGPMEDFYHRKVFCRLGSAGGERLHVVVPNEALLWAAPFLCDIAAALGDRGSVMIPLAIDESNDDDATSNVGLAAIVGKPLDPFGTSIEQIPSNVRGTDGLPAAERIKLADIRGYAPVLELIRNEVVWVRTQKVLPRLASRTASILFFGPPGCGKSRIARAICGELEQEARLLGPSDLKGLYIGWGQARIREQFDWVVEGKNRVLLIDEFDAVARSRRETEMHSDEKADVNELLVQLDRAGRAGRLVLCTTNFVSSLDEAVVRSGRFAHFIPVGPPDIEAASQIISYYFEQLERMTGEESSRVVLKIPAPNDSRAVVEVALRSGNGQAWYAGADLEEAVNRVFRVQLHRAVQRARDSDDGVSQLVSVVISAEDFERALASVGKSITRPAMEQFVRELGKYAGSAIATDILSSVPGAADLAR